MQQPSQPGSVTLMRQQQPWHLRKGGMKAIQLMQAPMMLSKLTEEHTTARVSTTTDQPMLLQFSQWKVEVLMWSNVCAATN